MGNRHQTNEVKKNWSGVAVLQYLTPNSSPDFGISISYWKYRDNIFKQALVFSDCLFSLRGRLTYLSNLTVRYIINGMETVSVWSLKETLNRARLYLESWEKYMFLFKQHAIETAVH